MAELPGLPPLPKCFSDVVNLNPSLTSFEEKEEESTLGGSISDTEFSSLSSPMSQPDGRDSLLRDGDTDLQCNASYTGSSVDSAVQSPEDQPSGSEEMSPFVKLNTALSTLKNEMAGLRELDVSLLCQLWSLNDAIQEYKVAVQDRYSETNSEYSWGMNSRTSSIGSFDDYDWNADIYLKPDGYVDSSLHGSTSSLLQQINELKERAESEFM
ncbi:protein FAM89A-like [Mizuhopecten yessoensis]|uniref:Protein FAM89B n=1 Tax=Mizuhopecten yessoensis TaxID=6573 RepID=A0A210PPK2_MIZYE|nr:protein FAM89A-like [Mizuhopecten yessoensis]OWF38374.1 Protein FAM89B [Mizuhopecten yessoensis]